MIKLLNRLDFRRFLTYVFGFIFFTLFIYLSIPFFFNYEDNKDKIEKKIFKEFGLNVNITDKVRYNFLPSPRIIIGKSEILGFLPNSKKIGISERIILRVPFKKLVNIRTLDFSSAELIKANIKIKLSEIKNIRNYINSNENKKIVYFKGGKIDFLDKENLIFSIDIDKIDIFNKDLINKTVLKGAIFNSGIKIEYQNNRMEKKPLVFFSASFPDIGLNTKTNISYSKTKKARVGRTTISFPNTQFNYEYIINKDHLNILESKFKNNYSKGKLEGKLFFSPFFDFELNLNIDLIKFKKLINSKFLDSDFVASLIPINNKINGKINVNIKEINSSTNLINSGKMKLELRNGMLLVNDAVLNIKKIGNIKITGQALQQKKRKYFVYDSQVNIKNLKIFYSRFLIPRQQRIDIKPINLSGKINLETYEINLNRVSGETELTENELFNLNQNLNEILLENPLENVFKYSNLRKIIQSFF